MTRHADLRGGGGGRGGGAREMEVLYNIRRWESEIAKGRREREIERERYKDNRLPKQNNVLWNQGGYVQLVISRTGEARGTGNKGRNEGEFTLKEKKHENTGVKKF